MLHREIAPHFIQVGKRRKLDGYEATLLDGDLMVHQRVYANFHEAEVELDRVAYEYLVSQPEAKAA